MITAFEIGAEVYYLTDKDDFFHAGPLPDEETTLISDMGGEVEVTRLDGDPSYAAALISRDLRGSGAPHGNFHILVHATTPAQSGVGGYWALYSLVSFERWRSILTKVEKRSTNLLVLDRVAVLWRCLREGDAILWATKGSFLFLAKVEGRPYFQSAESLNWEVEGGATSVSVLGENVRRLLDGKSVEFRWFSTIESEEHFNAGDQEELIALFREKSGLDGCAGPHAHLSRNGERIVTGLPELAKHAHPSLATKTGSSLALYKAKTWSRKIFAPACLLFCLTLTHLGFYAVERSRTLAHISELNQETIKLMEYTKAHEKEEVAPEGFKKVAELSEQVHALKEKPSLGGLLQSLNQATESNIRLLRIYSSKGSFETQAKRQPAEPTKIYVDAAIDTEGTAALSAFVGRMRALGYELLPVASPVAGVAGKGPAGTMYASYQIKGQGW